MPADCKGVDGWLHSLNLDYFSLHLRRDTTEDQKKDKSACEWLKNSIGNLAPLPFSVNRSLSDSVRDDSYPGSKKPDEAKNLCLDGKVVLSMWNNNGKINPVQFCRATINRFAHMYSCWYEELHIGEFFDFEKALTQETSCVASGAQPVMWRYSVMTDIKKELDSGFTFKHICNGNIEEKIPDDELHRMFCGEDWITLSYDIIDGLAVATVKYRSGDNWEIGYRKDSKDGETNSEVLCKVQKLCEEHAPDSLDIKHLCKNNTWWYWCEKLSDQTENIEQELVSRLNKLLGVARMLSKS